MSLQGWTVFALFWVVFVTSPGPNAINCIGNGMALGFWRALWGVLGILTQATLFLTLSALGVTALIAASPELLTVIRFAGAGVLVWLGIRSWLRAGQPLAIAHATGRHTYLRALAIATLNAKSVAGYLAAFTQFVQPDVALWSQMAYIYPTSLSITAASYLGYTALGAALGRAALGAVGTLWFRRAMAATLVAYGLILGYGGVAHGR